MSLNTTVSARVDESLKLDAEPILKELGLTTSQAMNKAKKSEGTLHDNIDDMMKDLKS